MGRAISAPIQQSTVVNQVPIGGITDVMRSGDTYKSVGESVKRSDYPALSAAFPRAGSLDMQVMIPGNTAYIPKAYAVGPNAVIAVGKQGTSAVAHIQFSYDGREWTNATMPSAEDWCGAAYGAGLFCVISATGKVATSPDGLVWTPRTALATGTWAGLAFGSGRFVAIQGTASSDVAATSDDGITFAPRTLPGGASQWLDVIFAGSQFVVVNDTANRALTSPDGLSWTSRTMPGAAGGGGGGLNGRLAYGVGRYIVVSGSGGIFSSADGVTWAVTPSGFATLKSVVFGNGVFIAFGVAGNQGLVATSYDGLTWRRRNTGMIQVGNANVAGYYLGVFLFIGDNGGTNSAAVCAENLTDSDYLYLRGPAGRYVRVK